MIGRAIRTGLSRDVVDLEGFRAGNYRQVDDYALGRRNGPSAGSARKSLHTLEEKKGPAYVVCPSPQGELLSQEVVETLSARDHLVIVCGHYEGLDERFIEKRVDREISLGDFVLTGGEIPAMAIIDAMARLGPGVIGKESAVVRRLLFPRCSISPLHPPSNGRECLPGCPSLGHARKSRTGAGVSCTKNPVPEA